MSEVSKAPGAPRIRSHITLALCAVLHGLTHVYGVMLVPLYLLMVADLNLKGVRDAAFIVTVYGTVYFLGSYIAGAMADRFDRKWILGIGLLGNAIAIGLMGFTRQYEMLIALGVLAGVAGTFFHPPANALITAHYPHNPGMAIGWMSVGAGVGFFLGPQYAGWRAATEGFWWIDVAKWQLPCIELGLLGLVIGVVFVIVAQEAPHSESAAAAAHTPLGTKLRWQIVSIAPVLALRDLAGFATLSLASVYLQKAHRMDTRQAGFILGVMMLAGVVANPLAAAVSTGRRRLPTLAILLIGASAVLATVPLWPVKWVLVALLLFQACQLATYAVADAAVLERVSPLVRGRVIGLWLTVAGTIGAMGPVVAGWWTDEMGDSATQPRAYLPAFGAMAFLMLSSIFAIKLISRIGPPISQVKISEEIMPATMETVA